MDTTETTDPTGKVKIRRLPTGVPGLDGASMWGTACKASSVCWAGGRPAGQPATR